MSTYFKDDQDNNSNTEKQNGIFTRLANFIQALSDKLQFYKKERWVVIGFLVFIYIIRLYLTGGYQALTYCIGIHLLNSFIGFISPMDDPEESGMCNEGGSFLPEK